MALKIHYNKKQLKNETMKSFWIVICCFFFLKSIDSMAQSGTKTIVLSDSLDAYYPLALEISNNENIEIIHELKDLKTITPNFLLWVISPENLTEKALVEYALFINKTMFNISMGIISGRNINDARYLWENRNYKPSNKFAIFNGTNESNSIKAKILEYTNNNIDTLILNSSNLKTALSALDYIQVSLHGAARSWFDEHSKFDFKYNELPALRKCVIQSHACNNFRPWIENSIAFECVNKGAIAFSGFVYSPISGSKIGEYDGLNFRYTWHEFPIGTIVQLQNAASLRTYAKFPHYFILGDPRLSFNTKPPYNIYQDSTIGDRRIIKLKNAMIGFLPVKITGGGDFEFIKISHGLKHSKNDLFFNKNIESINHNDDKYVLFKNTYSSVTIEMRKRVPFLWKIQDTTTGFIDSSIVSHQYPGFNIVIGGIFLILIAIKFFRGKIIKSNIFKSFIISLIGLGIIGILYMLRWNNISITSKQIEFNILSFIMDWFLLFSGILIYFNSKSLVNRFLASAIPFLHIYLFAFISLSLPLIRQILLKSTDKIDIVKSGYPLSTLLIEGIVGTILLFIILENINKKINQRRRIINST